MDDCLIWFANADNSSQQNQNSYNQQDEYGHQQDGYGQQQDVVFGDYDNFNINPNNQNVPGEAYGDSNDNLGSNSPTRQQSFQQQQTYQQGYNQQGNEQLNGMTEPKPSLNELCEKIFRCSRNELNTGSGAKSFPKLLQYICNSWQLSYVNEPFESSFIEGYIIPEEEVTKSKGGENRARIEEAVKKRLKNSDIASSFKVESKHFCFIRARSSGSSADKSKEDKFIKALIKKRYPSSDSNSNITKKRKLANNENSDPVTDISISTDKSTSDNVPSKILCLNFTNNFHKYLTHPHEAPFLINDILFQSISQLLCYEKAKFCHEDQKNPNILDSIIQGNLSYLDTKNTQPKWDSDFSNKWDQIKVDICYKGSFQKFTQNPVELRQQLIATHPYYLIDSSPNTFWGIDSEKRKCRFWSGEEGSCRNGGDCHFFHAYKEGTTARSTGKHTQFGYGYNYNGQILMAIRNFFLSA